MMLFRYALGTGGSRALIGCGALIALFGAILILFASFIAILIKIFGMFFVALGAIVVALGILAWIMSSRDDRIEPL